MPFIEQIDHLRREMFVEARGPISYRDIRDHVRREQAAGALGYPELIDARTATPVFSAAEVREIVGLMRREGMVYPLGPTAILVASDFAYGMLRMLEILIEDVCVVRPFRDLAEARDWLSTAPQARPEGDT